MNDLALRKRLLVQQADLHRQLLELERAQLRHRLQGASAFATDNPWPLVGGAALGGLLLGSKGGRFASWLPVIATIWRTLKR